MAALPAAAAAAYQAIAKAGAESAAIKSGTGAAASGASQVNFTDFLSDAVKDSISTIGHGEKMATKQVSGQANIVDVVNSVNAAELTLDTVVAVRDKVVAAYQSILNMPI